MSGAVKSGLLFALVGIAAVVGFSFIPIAGPIVCGPFAAALVGIGAGYLGVRWSTSGAGVGTGVLAGAIAGIGALIGSMIFWVIAIGMAQSLPGFQQQLQDAVQQQQPNASLNPSELNAIIQIAGPLLGICFGVFNLLLSLGLGALGGWIAARRNVRPPQMPTISSPLGPPPLDPPN
jgi:hypothetical protein